MPYRVLSWPSLMVTITRSCATSWKSSIFKFRSAIFLHAPGQELSQLSRGTNLHNSSLSNLSSICSDRWESKEPGGFPEARDREMRKRWPPVH